MNTVEKQAIKTGFPFGLYFKQLFSNDTYVRYINPFSFWRRYRTNHLETCYRLNIVQYFERCYQLDSRFAKPINIGSEQNSTNISTNHFTESAKLNTIYISQPRIELKYRGVSYYTKDLINIDIRVVEINSDIVKANNFRCTDNHHNASTSKKSGSN